MHFTFLLTSLIKHVSRAAGVIFDTLSNMPLHAGRAHERDPSQNRCTMQSTTATRHLRDAPGAPVVRSPCEAPAPPGPGLQLGDGGTREGDVAALSATAASADLGEYQVPTCMPFMKTTPLNTLCSALPDELSIQASKCYVHCPSLPCHGGSAPMHAAQERVPSTGMRLQTLLRRMPGRRRATARRALHQAS